MDTRSGVYQQEAPHSDGEHRSRRFEPNGVGPTYVEIIVENATVVERPDAASFTPAKARDVVALLQQQIDLAGRWPSDDGD